jgi:hypothetical protein
MSREIIPELAQRCKYWLSVITRTDIFTSAVIVLVGLASFGLGYNAGTQPTRVHIAKPTVDGQPPARALPALAPFVGSKHSDKYHYPWCSGAARIAPENMVRFESAKAALAAGYKPAQNCPGLQ